MILAQASSAVEEGLGVAGEAAEYTTNLELTTIVANIIDVILGLTGMAFVIILVYAGILYLTAAGEDKNIIKAKKLISSSILGIIIIIAAYAIARTIFAALSDATTGIIA